MELHSPTPTSSTSPVPATLDVGYRVDYRVRSRPNADVTARGSAAADGGRAASDDHDDSLVPAALAEIEAQRGHVELLLEAGVLGSCLSD